MPSIIASGLLFVLRAWPRSNNFIVIWKYWSGLVCIYIQVTDRRYRRSYHSVLATSSVAACCAAVSSCFSSAFSSAGGCFGCIAKRR